jgi:hypothetical protein
MKKEKFDNYISRFNRRDATTFEDYIHPDAKIINGTLVIEGMQGMKDHYAKIWQGFSEELHVERFVSDEHTLAIQMWTHFTSQKDDKKSLFGKVKAGETFDYHGIIMYEIEKEKFTSIKVSYLSFSYTNHKGKTVELGIPH